MEQTENTTATAAARRSKGLSIATVNRELQALRRIFKLAMEWRKVNGVLATVRILLGERKRERVISPVEERKYLKACPPLLKDVATILFDLDLRPEECFRLTAENFQGDFAVIFYGKGPRIKTKDSYVGPGEEDRSAVVQGCVALALSRPDPGRAHQPIVAEEAAPAGDQGFGSFVLRALFDPAYHDYQVVQPGRCLHAALPGQACFDADYPAVRSYLGGPFEGHS
jgi:hypothetical protein